MEEFIGDKRSKAYRAYKAEFNKQNESKSKGLGDTIAKITKATGTTWMAGVPGPARLGISK